MVRDCVFLIVMCVVLQKRQSMSKLGPGCGCLLGARSRGSQTPTPNSPLMTSDESSNAREYISCIHQEFLMCVSVSPACNSSFVLCMFGVPVTKTTLKHWPDHLCQSQAPSGPKSSADDVPLRRNSYYIRTTGKPNATCAVIHSLACRIFVMGTCQFDAFPGNVVD